ncbi:Mpv17/PMP22 family protein [Zalerion maritima]|uniref:Mpv17/PMP22 family protein n=1 Tax=Zalerion maritima TaxID=339359 RepID=A0AAD5WXX7_9PEZI|nr:Mpv17/PMP22 family protein [Zalerion maritima]
MAVFATASPFRAGLSRQFKLIRSGQKTRWNSSTPNSKTASTSSSTPPGTAKPSDPIPVPNTVAPLPLWQRLGPLTRAAEAYGRAQRKRPYVTQIASTLVVYLAADISAQNMSGNEYDPSRTARSLTIGGLSAVPAYKWFMWLAHSFNFASSRLLSIATKVVVNQLCFVPVFNSYFFGMQALLSGQSFEHAIDHIKRTVPTSFVNSWKLWPAVTAINFAFVPMEYRSVFGGVVGVGWQTYLAFLNRQAELQEEREQLKVLPQAAPRAPARNATGELGLDVKPQKMKA